VPVQAVGSQQFMLKDPQLTPFWSMHFCLQFVLAGVYQLWPLSFVHINEWAVVWKLDCFKSALTYGSALCFAIKIESKESLLFYMYKAVSNPIINDSISIDFFIGIIDYKYYWNKIDLDIYLN